MRKFQQITGFTADAVFPWIDVEGSPYIGLQIIVAPANAADYLAVIDTADFVNQQTFTTPLIVNHRFNRINATDNAFVLGTQVNGLTGTQAGIWASTPGDSYSFVRLRLIRTGGNANTVISAFWTTPGV